MAKTRTVRIEKEYDPAQPQTGGPGLMFFVCIFAWPIVLTVLIKKYRFLTFSITTTLGIITYLTGLYLTAGLIASVVAFFIYLSSGSDNE